MIKKLVTNKKTLGIAVVIALVAIVILFFVSQVPVIVSATVTPEVIVKGQPIEVTAIFIVKPRLFVNPKLTVVMAQRGNNGNPKTEKEWIQFYSEFKLNPKSLGQLKAIGKDEQGNTKYQATFTVNNLNAETLQIQPTNMFGMNLLPNQTSQMSRLAVTTRPAVIPNDPGEAGKVTLEGTDSDHDGIRDDVQREIMFLAPESEKLRMGLGQMASPNLLMIREVNLTEKNVDKVLSDFFDGNACFNYILLGDPTDYENYSIPKSYLGTVNKNKLYEIIRNTEERINIFDSNYNRHGFGSTGIDSISRCSFDPSKLLD